MTSFIGTYTFTDEKDFFIKFRKVEFPGKEIEESENSILTREDMSRDEFFFSNRFKEVYRDLGFDETEIGTSIFPTVAPSATPDLSYFDTLVRDANNVSAGVSANANTVLDHREATQKDQNEVTIPYFKGEIGKQRDRLLDLERASQEYPVNARRHESDARNLQLRATRARTSQELTNLRNQGDQLNTKITTTQDSSNANLTMANDYRDQALDLKRRHDAYRPTVIRRPVQPPRPTATGSGEYAEIGKTSTGDLVRAKYDYNADGDGDLSFKKGDVFRVIKSENNWWEVKPVTGQPGVQGFIPSNYIEPVVTPPPPPSSARPRSTPPPRETTQTPAPEGEVAPGGVGDLPIRRRRRQLPALPNPRIAGTAGAADEAIFPPETGEDLGYTDVVPIPGGAADDADYTDVAPNPEGAAVAAGGAADDADYTDVAPNPEGTARPTDTSFPPELKPQLVAGGKIENIYKNFENEKAEFYVYINFGTDKQLEADQSIFPLNQAQQLLRDADRVKGSTTISPIEENYYNKMKNDFEEMEKAYDEYTRKRYLIDQNRDRPGGTAQLGDAGQVSPVDVETDSLGGPGGTADEYLEVQREEDPDLPEDKETVDYTKQTPPEDYVKAPTKGERVFGLDGNVTTFEGCPGDPVDDKYRIVNVGEDYEGVKVVQSQDSSKCGIHAINNMFQGGIKSVKEQCEFGVGLQDKKDREATREEINRSRAENLLYTEVISELTKIDTKKKLYIYFFQRLEPGWIKWDPNIPNADDNLSKERSNDGRVYSASKEDMIKIIRENNKTFIGIIEERDGHYVAWVSKKNPSNFIFWYRIDSRFYFKDENSSLQVGTGRALEGQTYSNRKKKGDAGHICKYTEDNMIKYFIPDEPLDQTQTQQFGVQNLIIVSKEKYFDNDDNYLTVEGAGAGAGAGTGTGAGAGDEGEDYVEVSGAESIYTEVLDEKDENYIKDNIAPKVLKNEGDYFVTREMIGTNPEPNSFVLYILKDSNPQFYLLNKDGTETSFLINGDKFFKNITTIGGVIDYLKSNNPRYFNSQGNAVQWTPKLQTKIEDSELLGAKAEAEGAGSLDGGSGDESEGSGDGGYLAVGGDDNNASPLKLKRTKYLSPTSKIKKARKNRANNIKKLKVKK